MTGILASDDFELAFDAGCGGSITTARWRGLDILHFREAGSVLGAGCFPLVPFSNRIAGSRFRFDGREIALEPNHPGDPSSPVIHGFGWLGEWSAVLMDEREARLVYRHEAGTWPWTFEATETIRVFDGGFAVELGVQNLADTPMPVGLGFHPYFPRSDTTLYKGLHRGEWQNDAGCIPMRLEERPEAVDWWHGRPVTTRNVDTAFTQRQGPLTVQWPDRGMGARIEPSADLPFTVVYVPEGEDFFCVEPVSNMTDAFNRGREDSGMRVLGPGECWSVSMRVTAFSL